MEVSFYRLIKLRGRYAISFLNGLFHRHMLVLNQIEVSTSFRQFLFVQQVMHRHPRLCIKQSVMRGFVIRRGVMLHREQIGQREPDLATE